MTHQTIVVLDFGSQFTQLIARRLRELSVFSEILPPSTPAGEIAKRNPVGIILSGGPKSVDEPGAPKSDPELLGIGTPVLGICYGMQLMAKVLGGEVVQSDAKEFGPADLEASPQSRLLRGLSARTRVWVTCNTGKAVTTMRSASTCRRVRCAVRCTRP